MEYVSLDVFKWFEKHGIDYSEIVNDGMYIDLLKHPISHILNMEPSKISAKVRSEHREAYLFDGALDTPDETRCIYSLVVFKMMVRRRKEFHNDATIINFIRRGVGTAEKAPLLDEMVWEMLRTWKEHKLGGDASAYLIYAKMSGNAEMAHYLANGGTDEQSEFSYAQALL